MLKSKYFIFFILFLVVLSIFVSSYLDKDNTLKMQAIGGMDVKICHEIEHDFIKESCLENVKKQKTLFEKCLKKSGNCGHFY